jgi:hypothetical protein
MEEADVGDEEENSSEIRSSPRYLGLSSSELLFSTFIFFSSLNIDTCSVGDAFIEIGGRVGLLWPLVGEVVTLTDAVVREKVFSVRGRYKSQFDIVFVLSFSSLLVRGFSVEVDILRVFLGLIGARWLPGFDI